MADLRISQLPELTQGNLAQDDVLPITDVSASETKKIKSGNLIKDGIENLPNNSIPSEKVAFTNIDGSAIIDGSIDGNLKLKDLSVTTDKIADDAVTDDKIFAVNGSKLLAGTVTNEKLANGIDGEKLLDTSIPPSKLTAVDGAQIIDGTVTDAKIAGPINGEKIEVGTITDDKIVSLNGSKLFPESVTNEKIAPGLDGDKILDGSITAIKIVTVDGTQIIDGSVTNDKLAPGIDGEKLIDGSVTSDKLGDIDGTKIIAGTMPADRLDESTLNRSIDLDDSGNLGIANEITPATVSGITYNEQGLITDAVPLVGSDLPIATETTIGAIAVPPASGLTVSATGDIDHATVITPQTVSGVTVDEHGHVNSLVPLVGTDLPVATNDELGAIKVPAGGKLEVDGEGNLVHVTVSTGTGPFTKVEIDSTGHVTSGSGLEATDVPDLDASKIVSGQFPTERLGDDSVTGPKIADYATCLMQEDNPGQGDFLGQFWYTPSTAQLRVYSRGSGPENIWLPVGFGALQANNLRWGGTYDANADTIVSLTAIGVSEGLTAGQTFPAPSDKMSGVYFICQVAGSNCVQPDLNNINHTAGDWALCIDGTQGWVHIDVNGGGGGGGGGAQYLDDLLDVTIGGNSGPFSDEPKLTLANQQILKYDGGMGQWRNTDIIDGGSF